MRNNPHKGFQYEPAGKALRKLLESMVQIKFKELKEDVPYKGPEILSSSVLASNPNIKDHFTLQNIGYDAERDRDVIDTFINKVFQLGYSVGVENTREELGETMELYKSIVEKIK